MAKKQGDNAVPVKEKSVLYIMDGKRQSIDHNSLVAAQACALELQLPLAVIFCLEDSSDASSFEELKQTEMRLQANNIPLITVVGDPAKTLPTVALHLKPAVVYASTTEEMRVAKNYSAEVQQHPYQWPGPVISVEDVLKLNQTKLAC